MVSDLQVDETLLAARLKRLIEYDLPTFGLDWPLAERIARLHQKLDNRRAAQKYFALSVRMEEAQVLDLASQYEKSDKEVAVAEYGGHVALLYHYAGNEEKKRTAVDNAAANIRERLQKPLFNSDRFLLLLTLVYISLLDDDLEAAKQHISEMRELTTEPHEVKPAFPPPLEAVDMFIESKVTHDQALADRAIREIERYIEEVDIPIDTMGCISAWDLLNILQSLREQTSTDTSDKN